MIFINSRTRQVISVGVVSVELNAIVVGSQKAEPRIAPSAQHNTPAALTEFFFSLARSGRDGKRSLNLTPPAPDRNDDVLQPCIFIAGGRKERRGTHHPTFKYRSVIIRVTQFLLVVTIIGIIVHVIDLSR